MKRKQKSRWPEFLFTLAVHVFFGGLFGLLGGLLVGGWGLLHERTIHLINHWGESRTNLIVALWFVIWGLSGAVIAACQIPNWECPWYKDFAEVEAERNRKRDEEAAQKENGGVNPRR